MKEVVSRHHHRRTGRFDPTAPTEVELDIMHEKAKALGRTGGRLDAGLQRIRVLEERIGILEREGEDARAVNTLIREFNQVREKARQYLHYLIIQREAIGFRRHAHVTKMYQIPFKKRPLPEDDRREDRHL